MEGPAWSVPGAVGVNLSSPSDKLTMQIFCYRTRLQALILRGGRDRFSPVKTLGVHPGLGCPHTSSLQTVREVRPKRIPRAASSLLHCHHHPLFLFLPIGSTVKKNEVTRGTLFSLSDSQLHATQTCKSPPSPFAPLNIRVHLSVLYLGQTE